MLTASAAFALFIMLALSSVIYFIAQRFRLPYTVLLTLLGVLLVPLSALSHFDFIREFTLTPELLFYIFLPTLIFESAYNMSIRRVAQEFVPIMALAIIGYLVSSFAIGGGLWFVFDILGLPIPFMIALLFGALISATDPVAVLALFKEFGAPRRLSLIFEGESLMNDATALAFFLIILDLIASGISAESIGAGLATFISMLLGGTLFGLIFGYGFGALTGYFKNNEIVAVSLMLVLAHLTFLSSELFNELMHHEGLDILKLSPIIATTVSSLVMGNYARFKVTPRAEEFVEKFWSQFAFMANSVIFILVGLLFATIPSDASNLIVPITAVVIVVALARAVSVYGIVIPFNLFSSTKNKIPLSWQHLLAWGSLRGALAVMLALLVPPDLVVPNWPFDISVRDFLVIITVACVFATLFIKAPLVRPIMRRLHIDDLTPLEKVSDDEARAITHGITLLKIRAYADKGYIDPIHAEDLMRLHRERFDSSRDAVQDRAKDRKLVERALRVYLLGREIEVLKELLAFDEVSEHVFKKIYGKLVIQAELTEEGREEDINPSQTRDRFDVFENLAESIKSRDEFLAPEERIAESYLYYRAQSILASKVIKEIHHLNRELMNPVFIEDVLTSIQSQYEKYQSEAIEKKGHIESERPDIVRALKEALALRSIFRVEEKTLERLKARRLLTPKLYVTLMNEYEEDANERRLERIKRIIQRRL